MASYGVRDVRFGERTRYEDGVLWVDRDELRSLVLKRGDFADVAIDVVRPGEAVRLIHVIDAVEPRYKPGGETNFPGYAGPQRTVGEGRTNRLAGMALVSVGEAVAGEPTFWREALIDMSGPGAADSPFGTLVNLVLEF
jgi:glycine reductase